jgi:hypothetical protein
LGISPVDKYKSFHLAARALIVLLFCANLYRAWTQSITADEAFTHNVFLTGPPAKLFNSYDAAHHILHTILCKISISLFGLTEFTLRIPSLLGGLLYLCVALRLSRYLFGVGWLFGVSVALLTLNPFVLDHLSAARGYGLAVAFCLWALYQMVRYVSEFHGRETDCRGSPLVYKAAIGLALAVASNLTLLLPAFGLALLFLSVFWMDGLRARERESASRQFAQSVDAFVVPGICVAFVIVILPITKARMDQFYVGMPTLMEALRSLVAPSVWHHQIPWDWAVYPRVMEAVCWLVEKLLVPAVLILTALACAASASQWIRKGTFARLERIDQFLYLAGGTLLITLGLMVAGHYAFGVLYPFARTGLYLVPLFVLVSLALWKKLEKHRLASRILWFPLALLTGLCVLQFALQFQVSHYGQWRYDAGTKKIVNLIRRHAEGRDKVRVGISWSLEPSMNFYRRMYGLTWMEPLNRHGPAGSFDYYVLLPPETSLADKLGLSVLYRDALSEAVLAVPGGGNPSP